MGKVPPSARNEQVANSCRIGSLDSLCKCRAVRQLFLAIALLSGNTFGLNAPEQGGINTQAVL